MKHRRAVMMLLALTVVGATTVTAARTEAAGPAIKLVPERAVRGAPFRVKVFLVSRKPVGAFTFQLLFDPSAVEVTSIDRGEVDDFGAPITNSQSFRSGQVRFAAFQAKRLDGPTGRLLIAEVTLRPRGPTRTVKLVLEPITVADTNGKTYGVRKHTRIVRLRVR